MALEEALYNAKGLCHRRGRGGGQGREGGRGVCGRGEEEGENVLDLRAGGREGGKEGGREGSKHKRRGRNRDRIPSFPPSPPPSFLFHCLSNTSGAFKSKKYKGWRQEGMKGGREGRREGGREGGRGGGREGGREGGRTCQRAREPGGEVDAKDGAVCDRFPPAWPGRGGGRGGRRTVSRWFASCTSLGGGTGDELSRKG